ncbi:MULTISPECIES: hypothetical protein [unclassified Mesorhizobium]|jgi:hypothetical protein|uniref:hypothetical protein n=1 Tax=unclassified Mesorhizobium TaxID=325217 RepID=UPI000FE7FBF6|nr:MULTISPECIES: hypothetical protein [unclassified Mesorhizobium]RWI29690.1 MAG: hypothetical protein EOQ92_04965 [Mesorhizobium sp.]RWK49612.1 MAG: hypothetical protein EOR47_13350 [Mesorhizobium sp.]RWK93004.1 MAG: hypothetical protein EOR53_24835 [Mesorhizobium sp.]RWK93587.1 MAG: hypothetical protein EOR45_26710 [Mesorhizobium sp.]TIP58980.1 MAG: hypothetical protein E5X56_12685 [Mesorhizobium sp.]
MIRLVVIALIVVVAWFLLVKLIRQVKSANIDWTGIATIIGFIALAFWLRHITGMG